MEEKMEAIILAGGMGTRLKSVVADLPKPMAPIGDKPFLWYLFSCLKKYNCQKVILAVGYKFETIQEYFGDDFQGMKILYAIETEPLGTGGAVRKALELATNDNIFIINGDTLFEVDFAAMLKQHMLKKADVTIALKNMDNFSRYGNVIEKKNKIIEFQEKKFTESGSINGGIYCINKSIFLNLVFSARFSLEIDFFENYVGKLKFFSYHSDGFFIDIGIPEDYERSKKELVQIV